MIDDYSAIDRRFELGHELIKAFKNKRIAELFPSLVGSSQVLMAILMSHDFTQQEQKTKVIEQLKHMSELMRLAEESHGKYKLPSLLFSCGFVLDDLYLLIKLWENYSPLKDKLSSLGALFLVMGNHGSEYTLKKRHFRNQLRVLVESDKFNLAQITYVLDLAEEVYVLGSFTPELIEAIDELIDEIYCDTAVSCS